MSAVGGPSSREKRAFRRVKRPWERVRGLSEVLDRWSADGTARNVVWSHGIAPSQPRMEPIPPGLSGGVVQALRRRGVGELYGHQARAFELAAAGEHLVVATPTASGKSLCYNLPILHALREDPHAKALYLFPTKALARDQEQSLQGLMRDAGLDVGTITYDGDTPSDARRAARQRAAVPSGDESSSTPRRR